MNLFLTLRTERQELYKVYCHYKEDKFPEPAIRFIVVNDEQAELSETIISMKECETKEQLRLLEVLVPDSIVSQLESKYFFIEISYGSTTKLSSLNYIPKCESGDKLSIYELYNIHIISLLLSHSNEEKVRFSQLFNKVENIKDKSLMISNWCERFENTVSELLENNKTN